MNILVIGGTYFLGRVFVQEALKNGHTLTVLNRGRYSLNLTGVREVHADRHLIGEGAPAELKAQHYDAAVDFCGYREGDIRGLFESLADRFSHYIFVSTTDVYYKGTGRVLTEESPLETRHFAGENGDYIAGKVSLEKELCDCGREWKIPVTSARPCMIYGPYNYALRELWYAKQIAEGRTLTEPSDADAPLQFVYVRDAAGMLLALCGCRDAFDAAFNLCSEEKVSWKIFFDLLRESDFPGLRTQEMTCREIRDAGGGYFPFPLTKEEAEWCSAEKTAGLTGVQCTPFWTAMGETLRIFYRIFSSAGNQNKG